MVLVLVLVLVSVALSMLALVLAMDVVVAYTRSVPQIWDECTCLSSSSSSSRGGRTRDWVGRYSNATQRLC